MKKWGFVFAIPLALFLFCWGFVLGSEEGLYYREAPNTFEVRAAAGPLTMDEAKTLQYRRKYRDVEAETMLREFAIDLEQAKYIIENIDSYQVYTCEVTLENFSNGTIDGGRFVSEDPERIFINFDHFHEPGPHFHVGRTTGVVDVLIPLGYAPKRAEGLEMKFVYGIAYQYSGSATFLSAWAESTNI